jgi:hypothetical protein
MARLFHRLTSFEPVHEGTGWPVRSVVDDPWIVTSFEPGDLEQEPPLFKTFPSELPIVPLPRDLPAPEADTLAVLGRPVVEAGALDLAQLARLLHLSAGIVRTEDRSGGRIIPFRASGSAGGRFPLEDYVVVPEGAAAVPPGVHAYRPVEHDLVQVGPPPAGARPALVVTGIPWRTGWVGRGGRPCRTRSQVGSSAWDDASCGSGPRCSPDRATGPPARNRNQLCDPCIPHSSAGDRARDVWRRGAAREETKVGSTRMSD